VLLEKTPIDLAGVDFIKENPGETPIRSARQDGNGESSRQAQVTLAAIYPFPDAVRRVSTGMAGSSRLSAPRSQGNWASRRELAWAAVSRGAARSGTVAGGGEGTATAARASRKTARHFM